MSKKDGARVDLGKINMYQSVASFYVVFNSNKWGRENVDLFCLDAQKFYIEMMENTTTFFLSQFLFRIN